MDRICNTTRLKGLKIGIADEQPIILVGLESLLRFVNGIELSFSIKNYDDLLKTLKDVKTECDLLIIDVNFSREGNERGFRLFKKIKQFANVKHTLVLTNETCSWVLKRLLDLGASGIMSKKDDLSTQLESAIKCCCSGGVYISPVIKPLIESSDVSVLKEKNLPVLTDRELEVVLLYVEGLRLKDIADKLKRSVATIAVHKHNAMNKLNIDSNIQLISYVRGHGLG